MGQKDISEKLLEDYNDVFADIVNVLLFQGRNVVEPYTLSAVKVKSQYKANDSKLHEMERDVAKHWKKEDLILALYGIENQTMPEKLMPARVLAYDGVSYRSQLMERKKHSLLHPVVTIVLYFGMGRWNQPKNLKEILRIPDDLNPFVNDYKIHVFEIAWLTEEQVNMFQSDFRIVAEYFTQIRKNNEYVPTEQEIRHVDEVLKLLSVFGGEEGIEKFLSAQRKKEDDKMAGVIDRMVEERAEKRAQEKAEKIAAEMAQNMAQNMAQDMVQDMVQDITKEMAVKFVKGGLPLEQVAEAMGVNAQQVKDWIAVRK